MERNPHNNSTGKDDEESDVGSGEDVGDVKQEPPQSTSHQGTAQQGTTHQTTANQGTTQQDGAPRDSERQAAVGAQETATEETLDPSMILMVQREMIIRRIMSRTPQEPTLENCGLAKRRAVRPRYEWQRCRNGGSSMGYFKIRGGRRKHCKKEKKRCILKQPSKKLRPKKRRSTERRPKKRPSKKQRSKKQRSKKQRSKKRRENKRREKEQRNKKQPTRRANGRFIIQNT